MVIAFVAGAVAAVTGAVYVGKKYHSSTAALAAVKAELSKVESSASAEVVVLVNKLKSLL